MRTEEGAGVAVFHGSEVDILKLFFCEALWDDEFHRGDIDQADNVFGSGDRIREKVRSAVNAHRRLKLKAVILHQKVFAQNSPRTRHCRRSYAFRKLGYDCWFEYLFPWALEKAKEKYEADILR